MKLLDKYVLWQCVVATLVALLALLALYSVFEMVAEAKNIGGDFTTSLFFKYMALKSPGYAYQVFPIAVLVGAMLTLSRMSVGQEYAVMRASGVSTKRMLILMAVFSMIMAVLISILGDAVVPGAERRAHAIKTNAVHGGNVLKGEDAVWLRDGNLFIEIEDILPDGSLRNLTAYEVGESGALASVNRMASAIYRGAGKWSIDGVSRTVFNGDGMKREELPNVEISSKITPSFLTALKSDSSQMSTRDLKGYIKHLERNKQSTKIYEIAFWTKIFYPLVAFAMALIAFLFTPVSSRHSNVGLRIFVAMLVGVAFHFLNRFFGFYAQLFTMPAFLAALMPPLVFVAASMAYWRWGRIRS